MFLMIHRVIVKLLALCLAHMGENLPVMRETPGSTVG